MYKIYKKYNFALNKLLRKTKNEYFKNKLQENQGHPSKTWDTIRSVIGGKKAVVPAGNGNREATDLVNDLAKHFSEVG